MRVIYKYTLPMFGSQFGSQFVSLPSEASILTVGYKDDMLCMWASVDPSKPSVPREFKVIGTGHPIEDDALNDFFHAGSAVCGEFVWHVFARFEE
jgi:hypothetical protein